MGVYVKTLNNALGPIEMNYFVFNGTCDSKNIDKYIMSHNHIKIFFDPPPGIIKIKTKINGT